MWNGPGFCGGNWNENRKSENKSRVILVGQKWVISIRIFKEGKINQWGNKMIE